MCTPKGTCCVPPLQQALGMRQILQTTKESWWQSVATTTLAAVGEFLK